MNKVSHVRRTVVRGDVRFPDRHLSHFMRPSGTANTAMPLRAAGRLAESGCVHGPRDCRPALVRLHGPLWALRESWTTPSMPTWSEGRMTFKDRRRFLAESLGSSPILCHHIAGFEARGWCTADMQIWQLFSTFRHALHLTRPGRNPESFKGRLILLFGRDLLT